MKNIPKEIYLNLGIPKREMNIDKSDDISFDDLNDITWSKDKIDDQDLKFVLSDVYVSQQRELLDWLSNEPEHNIIKSEINEILEDFKYYNES